MSTRFRIGLGLMVSVVLSTLLFNIFSVNTASAYNAGQINTGKTSAKFTAANAQTITMVVDGDTITFKSTGCGPASAAPGAAEVCTYSLQGTIPDRCEEGRVGAALADTRANIKINKGQFASPGTKLSGTLTFFREVGGRCVQNGIQPNIQVNNGFGAELVLAAAGSPDDAADDEDEPTCENKTSDGFGWMLCPALRWADDGVLTMTDAIENLLDFDIKKEIDEENVNKLQQAWSIVRNLCTIVLIIIMLVMVISQAVDWGPFDAYSVKRVLPKLVIAIVVMQISWPLFLFTVDAVNAIGRGIGDLMYAPFGGPQEMTLQKIGAGSAGDGTAGLFGLILLSGAITGIVAAPLLLGVAVSAAAALFLGYVVLVVREVLIILCLIFAPLALTLWILPGTNKYWKLWYETFSKLLLMFPLIIALIAAGRIFAYTAASGAFGNMFGAIINPFVNFGGVESIGILQLFFIFVGFFAPFFLIPKTFQLGGRAIGAIAGFASNKSQGISGRGKKFAHGWNERNRGKRAANYDSSGSKFSRRNLAARIGSGTLLQRDLDSKGNAYHKEEAERRAHNQARAAEMRTAQGGLATDALSDLAVTGSEEQRVSAIKELVRRGEFGALRDLMVTENPDGSRTINADAHEAYEAAMGDDATYKAVYASARDLVPQLIGERNARLQAMTGRQYNAAGEAIDTEGNVVAENSEDHARVRGVNAMSAGEILSSHHQFLQGLRDDASPGGQATRREARQRIDEFVALNPTAAGSLYGTRAEGHLDDLYSDVVGGAPEGGYREYVGQRTSALYGGRGGGAGGAPTTIVVPGPTPSGGGGGGGAGGGPTATTRQRTMADEMNQGTVVPPTGRPMTNDEARAQREQNARRKGSS